MKFETPQNTELSEQKKKQALAREHLNDGVPHMVFNLIKFREGSGHDWVSSIDNLRNKEAIEKIIDSGYEVAEYYDADRSRSYIKINELDKYSLQYKNCVGMIFIGTSKQSGKEISFVTHVSASDSDYDEWQRERIKKFDEALNSGIQELKIASADNTIDAVMFGGSSLDQAYKSVIDRYSKMVHEELGFEPVVLTGPGGYYGYHGEEDFNIHCSTDVYLNTQERKMYILRREVPDEKMDKPYYASQVANNEEK